MPGHVRNSSKNAKTGVKSLPHGGSQGLRYSGSAASLKTCAPAAPPRVWRRTSLLPDSVLFPGQENPDVGPVVPGVPLIVAEDGLHRESGASQLRRHLQDRDGAKREVEGVFGG